ncbi:hypothetical protein IMZ48_11765 [Candidatus Bathyarchaeota archaeon]|nr:hypothetical protein [Candidatus Bathyarchaeota archaeon]
MEKLQAQIERASAEYQQLNQGMFVPWPVGVYISRVFRPLREGKEGKGRGDAPGWDGFLLVRRKWKCADGCLELAAAVQSRQRLDSQRQENDSVKEVCFPHPLANPFTTPSSSTRRPARDAQWFESIQRRGREEDDC